MQELKDRIVKEGKVLPGNIIKVDGFLNHRIDTELLGHIAEEFGKYFNMDEVTMILTAEAKGIALATAVALEDKGIIKKQARYMARKKAHLSNLYIVRDVPSMWLPDTINNSMDLDITDAISRKCILYKRMFVQQSIDNVTPKRVILLR